MLIYFVFHERIIRNLNFLFFIVYLYGYLLRAVKKNTDMKFSEFDLNDTLLEAIYYANFDEATEIQAKAIPLILEGKDLIGCAQTGTGKTAAFVLPMLNQLSEIDSKGVKALILCPTRELAIQIDRQVQGLAYFTNSVCRAVYGLSLIQI